MGFRLDRPDTDSMGKRADPNCKICYGKGYYVVKHVCFGPDPHNEYEECLCSFKNKFKGRSRNEKKLE